MVKKHGMAHTRIYAIWRGMKYRCNNPNLNTYPKYGGRGIRVCKEWNEDFMSFYEWSMKNGYTEELTLDRKDPNGHYEPSNCRWATWQVQQNNKRTNHYIEINGVTKTAMDWSKESGVPFHAIISRHKRGFKGEEIIAEYTSPKVIIDFEGEQLTLKEISDRYNIGYETIGGRYRAGKRGKELVEDVVPVIKVEFEGKEYTLSELEELSGIKYKTLLNRHNKGLTGKDLVIKGRLPVPKKPKKEKPKKERKIPLQTIEINGITKTVVEWSRISGISAAVLRNRLKAGATGETVLKETELGAEINGERKSIMEWSRISGIAYDTIKTRYHSGIRGEALLEQPKHDTTRFVIEINGEKNHLREWERITGIDRNVIKRRYEKGIRGKALLEKPKEKSPTIMVEINGEMKTIKQISQETGIKFTTLKRRYYAGKRGQDLIKPV